MTTHDEFRNIMAFVAIASAGTILSWTLVDCIFGGSKDRKKFDTRRDAKRKCVIKTTKMPRHSKYYAIYNVSQGKWAQLPLSDDAETTWRDNNWPEGEGLVGFWYDEDDNDAQDIIYCPEGHVIYMAGGDIFGDKYEYHLEESTYTAPPAILVNLSNQFDTKFLRRKGEPNWWGHGSASDCEPESESESEEEEPAKKRARVARPDTAQVKEERIKADITSNQPIIDFLYRCYDATTNPFKRKAYARAINSIASRERPVTITNYWNDWNCSQHILPAEIGASIARKIREFLDGVVEEDIMAEPKKTKTTAKGVKRRARKADGDDTPQVEWPGGWRIQTTVPGNRPIVDFLYRCYDATTNTFKRKAYARAIIDVSGYWNDLTEVSEYDLPRLLPELSENMICKIREFLDGVPEEDIINS